MQERHIDGGQPETHFSGTEQGFEVFDLLVNELKKTDALTGYHTDTHTRAHTADILHNILHIYIHIQTKCNLCLWEKYYIICRPNMATLNNRNELVSSCRHAKKFLLNNVII